MSPRRIVRHFGRVALYSLGVHGFVHLASSGYLAWTGTRVIEYERRTALPTLRTDQQPMVSALTRVLVEERVVDAERSATAIGRGRSRSTESKASARATRSSHIPSSRRIADAMRAFEQRFGVAPPDSLP